MSNPQWSSTQSVTTEPRAGFPDHVVEITDKRDWLVQNTSGVDAFNVTLTDAAGVKTRRAHVAPREVIQPEPPIFHPLGFADVIVRWALTETGAQTESSGVSVTPGAQ